MFVVSTSPDLIADLYEAGTAGIIEHDGWVEAFFEDRDVAARFGDPFPAAETDWVQQTLDAWPPFPVGDKFFVAAPWREEPTPPGRIRLVINPGMLFGTGRHECTQLCLEALEREVRPGDSVLDVGTGSGILALAAKLLGAGRVVACDTDADAASIAEVPFFVGSVDAVRSNTFDVVVANINEEVVGAMLPDFERVAARRILSGFQDDDNQWTCIVR